MTLETYFVYSRVFLIVVYPIILAVRYWRGIGIGEGTDRVNFHFGFLCALIPPVGELFFGFSIFHAIVSGLDAYEDAVVRRARAIESKRRAAALLAENPDAAGALSLVERERVHPADRE